MSGGQRSGQEVKLYMFVRAGCRPKHAPPSASWANCYSILATASQAFQSFIEGSQAGFSRALTHKPTSLAGQRVGGKKRWRGESGGGRARCGGWYRHPIVVRIAQSWRLAPGPPPLGGGLTNGLKRLTGVSYASLGRLWSILIASRKRARLITHLESRATDAANIAIIPRTMTVPASQRSGASQKI